MISAATSVPPPKRPVDLAHLDRKVQYWGACSGRIPGDAPEELGKLMAGTTQRMEEIQKKARLKQNKIRRLMKFENTMEDINEENWENW